MVDKATFMETLRSVQELAKTSPEPMAREEIQEYFKDMELTAEQQELVYQYFQKPQEEPNTAEQGQAKREAGQQFGEPDPSLGQPEELGRASKKQAGQKHSGSGKKAAHSQHFQMYLNDIERIPDLPQEGQMELYQRLLAGDKSAASAILDQWLKKIAAFAGAYASGQTLVEDLVQEGNMGLLLGMEELLGAGEQYPGLALNSSDMEQKLENYVREAMGRYRQETEGMAHGESTILAKANLVHEAQKVLAEENGTIPDLQELSDYTRIPMEEIRDILALSRKQRKE